MKKSLLFGFLISIFLSLTSVFAIEYEYNPCGNEMFWRMDGNTIVFFGEGGMYEYPLVFREIRKTDGKYDIYVGFDIKSEYMEIQLSDGSCAVIDLNRPYKEVELSDGKFVTVDGTYPYREVRLPDNQYALVRADVLCVEIEDSEGDLHVVDGRYEWKEVVDSNGDLHIVRTDIPLWEIADSNGDLHIVDARYEWTEAVDSYGDLHIVRKDSKWKLIQLSNGTYAAGESIYDYKEIVLSDGNSTIVPITPWNYEEIERVYISKEITGIDESVIVMSKNVTEFEVEEGNAFYTTDEYGALYNYDKSELIRFPCRAGTEHFIVPDTVRIIGAKAFSNNTYLKSVTFPETVEDFGEGVFDNTNIIIKGYAGSNSESFALTEGLVFQPIGEELNSYDIDDDGIVTPQDVTNIINLIINKDKDSQNIMTTFDIYSVMRFIRNTFVLR